MTEPGQLSAALAAVLADRWGGPVEVADLRRLPGGASRETWAFEARTGDDTRRLVLRRDPPHAPRPRDMAQEAAVLGAAARAGVPVPALHAVGDGTDGVGSSYLLMDYLDGETIPRRLLRDPRWERARAGLAGELGRALARIHAIPVDDVPGLADEPELDPLDRLRAIHDAFGEPRPALEVAFRWLAEHRPPPGRRCVVHGDFRNGNLLLGPDGLRAVLDWELVHHGDPVDDLGWLCVKAWRFGAPAPVGGFGDRAELLDGYAEVAGWRPGGPALRWWEVFGTARWAVICRQQAQRHLGGTEPSVELAVLGRRICESEYDVLLALGLATPTPVTDPLNTAVPTRPTAPHRPTESDQPTKPDQPTVHDRPPVHDRPTVAELLDATRAFLTDELAAAGLDQRVRFHTRVAANALAIARRELLVGEEQRAAHTERLAGLGCADDDALVAAIRSGALDARWDQVLDAVRALTMAKLTVANPRYPAQPGA